MLPGVTGEKLVASLAVPGATKLEAGGGGPRTHQTISFEEIEPPVGPRKHCIFDLREAIDWHLV